MLKRDAVDAARSAGLNLLFISSIPGNREGEKIAVVQMTTPNDHNKAEYRKMKEKKEIKKEKGKDIGFKDIQLTINSESNDITIKAKQASKFLDRGGKVRVAVGYKAWDNEPIECARALIDEFKGSIDMEVKVNTSQGGNSKGKKYWVEIQKASNNEVKKAMEA